MGRDGIGRNGIGRERDMMRQDGMEQHRMGWDGTKRCVRHRTGWDGTKRDGTRGGHGMGCGMDHIGCMWAGRVRDGKGQEE